MASLRPDGLYEVCVHSALRDAAQAEGSLQALTLGVHHGKFRIRSASGAVLVEIPLGSIAVLDLRGTDVGYDAARAMSGWLPKLEYMWFANNPRPS